MPCHRWRFEWLYTGHFGVNQLPSNQRQDHFPHFTRQKWDLQIRSRTMTSGRQRGRWRGEARPLTLSYCRQRGAAQHREGQCAQSAWFPVDTDGDSVDSILATRTVEVSTVEQSQATTTREGVVPPAAGAAFTSSEPEHRCAPCLPAITRARLSRNTTLLEQENWNAATISLGSPPGWGVVAKIRPRCPHSGATPFCHSSNKPSSLGMVSDW